ncbi:hypothetical protein ACWCQL_24005 [Streptomyces sp. NPDC002073]
MKSLIVVSSGALSLMAFGAVGAEFIEGESTSAESVVSAPFVAEGGVATGDDWGWS